MKEREMLTSMVSLPQISAANKPGGLAHQMLMVQNLHHIHSFFVPVSRDATCSWSSLCHKHLDAVLPSLLIGYLPGNLKKSADNKEGHHQKFVSSIVFLSDLWVFLGSGPSQNCVFPGILTLCFHLLLKVFTGKNCMRPIFSFTARLV